MQKQNEKQWSALWQRLGAKNDGNALYKELTAHYEEPHRRYHTLAHIDHCLGELDTARHIATNPDAVELSLWFHDVIYDTKADNNEERNAKFALAAIKKASLPDSMGQLVVKFILATRHISVPVDPDARLVADIDLSFLGLPDERFDENSHRIREEHKSIPDDEFFAAQSAFLKSLLERSSIYSTQFFRDKYEAQARRNIERYLRKPSGRLQ